MRPQAAGMTLKVTGESGMYGDPFFLHTNKILLLLQETGHLVSRTRTQSTALKGGYWNVLMRVQAPKKDMVVKQFRTDAINPMFPNMPDAEARALKTLTPLGLSPAFIDYLPDVEGGPVLIYQYVEGNQWTRDYDAVGRLFRKLHDAHITEDFRMLSVEPVDILAQAREALNTLPVDSVDRVALEACCPVPISHPGLVRRSLIHTDTGPGNLIQNSDSLVLIDWQCPGLGDPVEDITCFISPGMQILYNSEPLSCHDIDMVLESYGDPAVTERFRQLRVYYHYRFLSYYVFRSFNLRDSDPDVAALYDRAFVAELALLKELCG